MGDLRQNSFNINNGQMQNRLILGAREFVCDCGENTWEPKPVMKVEYNPLDPQMVQCTPGQRLVCIECGRFGVIQEVNERKKWVSVRKEDLEK